MLRAQSRVSTISLLLLMVLAVGACNKEGDHPEAEAHPKAVESPPIDEATRLTNALSQVNVAEAPDSAAFNCGRLQKALEGRPFPEDLRPTCIEAMLTMAERSALGQASVVMNKSSDAWIEEAQNFGATKKELASAKKKISAAERRAAAEATRKAAEAQKTLREEGAAARREMAERMRTSFLDNGLDIKVKTSGKHAERITFQFVLFNDVWSHRFQKEGIISQLRVAGFERIDMTDGYDWHVYWD